jgi:hypothetical protein
LLLLWPVHTSAFCRLLLDLPLLLCVLCWLLFTAASNSYAYHLTPMQPLSALVLPCCCCCCCFCCISYCPTSVIFLPRTSTCSLLLLLLLARTIRCCCWVCLLLLPPGLYAVQQLLHCLAAGAGQQLPQVVVVLVALGAQLSCKLGAPPEVYRERHVCEARQHAASATLMSVIEVCNISSLSKNLQTSDIQHNRG